MRAFSCPPANPPRAYEADIENLCNGSPAESRTVTSPVIESFPAKNPNMTAANVERLRSSVTTTSIEGIEGSLALPSIPLTSSVCFTTFKNSSRLKFLLASSLLSTGGREAERDRCRVAINGPEIGFAVFTGLFLDAGRTAGQGSD